MEGFRKNKFGKILFDKGYVFDSGVKYIEDDGHILQGTRKRRAIIVECTCGESFRSSLNDIKHSKIKSCGCKHLTAGGRSTDRLFGIWKNIISRCENDKSGSYSGYGGRGISVCDDWKVFDTFEKWSLDNGYSEKLSIDRVNVNGNYEPNNCRWADGYTQSQNTRVKTKSKTGYSGIYKEWNGTYRARLMFFGKRKTVGTFKTIEEAIYARDKFIVDNNLSDFNLINPELFI